MKYTKFYIDLGNGDGMDVTVNQEKEYTLDKFLNDIQGKEWANFGEAAVQVSSIKRIIIK